MTEADEMRALDREIAELLGYKALFFDYGDGTTDWAVVHESEIQSFVSCSTRPQLLESCSPPKGVRHAPFQDAPAFSSTWEGFGLLVEECERRGWDWQGGEWNWLNTAAKTKHRSRSVIVFTGDRNRCDATGRDIRHAFALAMRDALREAQG